MLGDRGRVDRVAQSVYVSPDVLGAPRVIAIVVSGKFRSLRRRRAAQNFMLAAWKEGVVPLSERNRGPESLRRAAWTQGA